MKKVLFLFLKLLSRLFGLRGPLFSAKLLGRFIFELNQQTGPGFVTVHSRPRSHGDVTCNSLWANPQSDVTILIQGPIVERDNFTVETVKLYRGLYPDCSIIVSTWKGSEWITAELAGICTCLFADPPKTRGSHNINLQRSTTLAGVEKAFEAGSPYLLKTRTDQRFYRPETLSVLKRMLEDHPVAPGSQAKGRIIELSISVCKYRPWSMCDMFQFGYASDLLRMWNFPEDPRDRSAAEYASVPYRVQDIVNENVAEILVHRTYASSLGFSAGVDYESYFNFIFHNFIILDKELVDLFWMKYGAQEYGWASHPLYDANQLLARFTYADWLMLIAQGPESIPYEQINHYLDAYEVT